MPLQSRLSKLITPFDDDSNDMSPAGGAAGLDEVRANINPDMGGVNPRLLALSPLMQQYSQMMQSFPKPEDYKASKTRRVLAALAGGMAGGSAGALHNPNAPLIGYEIGQDIVHKPYDTAVKNWTGQAKALGEGANVESRTIGYERQLENAQSLATSREAASKLNEEKLAALEKERASRDADRDAKFQQDQEKLQNDYKIKTDDMERKVKEASDKLAQAQAETTRKAGDAAAMRELAQARIDAMNAQHQLENVIKEKELKEKEALHANEKAKWEAEAKDREARITALTAPIQKTEETVPEQGVLGRLFSSVTGYQPHGKMKVTTTSRVGATTPSGAVKMIGPDGKTYEIPSDKVEDAKKNGMKLVQ